MTSALSHNYWLMYRLSVKLGPDVAKKHYLDNDGLDMDEAVKILDAIGL